MKIIVRAVLCLMVGVAVLMAGAPRNARGAQYYIPHITTGFTDWTDILQAANNSLFASSITVTLYSGGSEVYSQSHEVPAMGETVLYLKQLAASAECGVVSSTDDSLFVRITYQNEQGGIAQYKLSGSLEESLGFYFGSPGTSLPLKGLALANFSESASAVTFYAVGSNSVLDTASVSIDPKSRIFGAAQDWFSGLSADEIDRVVVVCQDPSLSGITQNADQDISFLLFSSAEPVTGFVPESADPEAEYVVFAWNDLGMHCLNPTYDTAVILPPYNTVWSMIVKKAAQPEIITSGVSVAYEIVDNTYSYGKRDYGQFWDNASDLFGVSLATDTGLNLVDPERHNGLSGTMVSADDHYQVDGIPVTPVNDSMAWNPYQVAEVVVTTPSGVELGKTRATVPTSDEINCSSCHGSNPFSDILSKHDQENGTSLQESAPVLCATCHGSPALGGTTAGSSGKYLSQAIHGSHASRGAACYDCHPGPTVPCNRSTAHTAQDGNCTTCHGSMANVANTIQDGTRTPWVNEPKCIDCHTGVPGVDTGDVLYRNATGHGGLYCSTCHGSPHAMLPSGQGSDSYQALQYQGKNVTIGSCAACHESSRGGEDESEDKSRRSVRNGDDSFAEVHGGSSPEKLSACHVCHTSVSSDTTEWPHQFLWNSH